MSIFRSIFRVRRTAFSFAVRPIAALSFTILSGMLFAADASAAILLKAVANPSSAAAGQRVRYAVTVSNTGATNQYVTLTAGVPVGTTVADNELSLGAYCNNAGFATCAAGQTLEFSGFYIAPGASVTVVYPALVSTTAPPANGTALKSTAIATIGTAKVQATASATFSTSAATLVHLTASALPAQARAGGTLTYTLTYGNPGTGGVAANLTFPLPAGTTFVSASDGGTSSAGTVTWPLGTLAAGSAARRTLVLQVASTVAAGSELAIDAALRNPTTQAVLTQAALTTPVGNATVSALNVRAVATPDPAAPGQRVRYAVTLSNTAAASHYVYLTATVPANTTVADNELSLGAYCDNAGFTTCAAGQTLQFSGFYIAAGASVTVTYTALISTTTPPANGTLLNSDVWADDSTVGSEYQLAVAAIAESSAISSLHLTASALPAQARAGGTVTYTLTYGNPGTGGVAANLTFPLPAGTTFVSASDGGTSSAGTVTWPLGTLAAGSAARRTLVLQVASTAAAGSQLAVDAALRNPTTQAVLSHAGLTTPVGNATVSALNVRAVATPDPAAPGQRVRYAVTLSNTAAASHYVYLTATVPANTTVADNELSLGAYCDNAGFTTCAAGQTLQFSGFYIAAGASATVTYTALISTTTPPANGTLLNSDVWADDSTVGSEYQLAVAAIAESSAISSLHLTASALPAQARAGGTVTYTLTYGNPGTTGVAANLTFLLPAGTTFVSASDGGTSSAGTVTWPLGTLAAGSAARRTLVLQVASTVAAGSELAIDAALRNPTTQAVLTQAALTTPVGNATVSALNVRAVATPDPAAPGQRVRYAVTLSNTAATSHYVYLTATVPANTTVADNELSLGAYCDNAGFTTCAAGQTLQFSGFYIAAGASATVTYTALISTTTPPANGTLLNSDVWADDYTVGSEYQLAVAAIAESTAIPSLHLTASALPAQARAGGTVTYTLTYGNPGSTGVAANLTFPLPAGTTFVSASDGGTSSAGTVTWPLGTLAAGSAARRTLVLQVASTAAAGTQLAVDAALRNPTTQAVLTHTGLTTPVGNATVSALNVRAVATPDPAAPGQRVRYAVTISNTAAASHYVYLTATVPANTTVADNELSLGAYCDNAGFTTCAAGQTLQFSGFYVAAGASATVTYTALISTTTPPPNGTLLNSDVWADDSTVGSEYQLAVAAIAESTAIPSLHLTASALPAQARASGTVTYTLTYGNAGSTGVAANLSFPLPAGTTFVSASNGGTHSAGTVTWPLGTLAAGSAARRTIVLQVASTAAAGSQLAVDAALLSPTTQAALTHAGLTTPVGNATVSALNVSAVATPDPAAPGKSVKYAVTISNTAAASHYVYLTATVPTNTTVASTGLSLGAYCDNAGFTTCAAGQTLQFSGFYLAAGASVTVTYSALISTTTPPANGTLLNSDVWADDSTIGSEYQLAVAAIASKTATAVPQDTATGWPMGPGPMRPSRPASSANSAAHAPSAAAGASVAAASAVAAASTERLANNSAPRTADSSTAAGAATTAAQTTRVILALDRALIENDKYSSTVNAAHIASSANAANANAPWANDLAQRLRTEDDASRHWVVEQGVTARALSAQGIAPQRPSALGEQPASKANYVILFQGTEGPLLGTDGTAGRELTAQQMIARDRQIIAQAHALGLKILGATITPFEGTTYPGHTAPDEALRKFLNAWIRTSGAFDAVVDFDLATCDPQHPTRLLPAYDSGDHLRPNDAGYQAMADAVDLSVFIE